MPELVEVEQSRRLSERLIGRSIHTVELFDPHASSIGGFELSEALALRTITAARRRGKLLLIDTDGPSLGIHFGMTGRLVVDGQAALERLLYSPASLEKRWLRFQMRVERGAVELHDSRRFARVLLDPDETLLGPDALSVTIEQLRAVVTERTRGVALKARLLDQSRLAGVGNLIADEVLWRAALSPRRQADSLDPGELRRLHRHLHYTIELLLARGGSHTGDLMGARMRGGACPKDRTPLTRSTVGGRTTYWCPAHQH